MFVLALRVELRLPGCRSLKDRRQAIKPILEGARNRFGVSAAEVGSLDKWQRADLGFAVVSGQHRQVVDITDELERFIWSFPEVEVIGSERTWLDGG